MIAYEPEAVVTLVDRQVRDLPGLAWYFWQNDLEVGEASAFLWKVLVPTGQHQDICEGEYRVMNWQEIMSQS